MSEATPETPEAVEKTFVDGTVEFYEMDDEALEDAISGSRQRGVYDEKIVEFLRSGRRGVQINLAAGDHESKKPASVKTGYESARTKLADGKSDWKGISANDEEKAELVKDANSMKVVLKGDNVYLIRTAPAAAPATA